MTTLTVPANSKPFLKTLNPLGGREAGEAIDIIQAVYLNADGKVYIAIGISITQAELGSQVIYSYTTGDVIDFQGTLTVGSNFWLFGNSITDSYSDIASLDFVVKLGYCNEDGDWVTNIINQGEVK